MPRKNFSDEQIAHVLRQAEAGAPVQELIRKTGITEQIFYRWKRRFVGMGVAELRRLRQLDSRKDPQHALRI